MKEQLIKCRDEISDQFSRTANALRSELDRNPEEQARQVEQDQVSIMMESSLRRELIDIEEKLAEIGGDQER